LSASVPTGYYTTEIGKARQVSVGNDVSIITYGLGVQWAEKAATAFDGVDFDIVDLRTLMPLDFESITASVKRTGRVLILHEDTMNGGIGAELSARIAQDLFERLDAPVERCASLDTPVPFAADLENAFLANNRLIDSLNRLLEY